MVSLDMMLGRPARKPTKKRSGVGNRLLPTGQCWCGCGQDVARGSFFLPGHDKKAESAIIIVEYGGVPEFLAEHGYAPGGKNPLVALEKWRRKNNNP
jgi:hypothetical protein